jgi:hypothetical protein
MTISTVNQDRWEYQMAFKPVEKNLGTGRAGQPAADVQMAKWTGQSGSIMISTAIASKLGWSAKDKIEIAIGADEDAGWYALRRGSAGYALTTSNKASKQFKINSKYILTNVVHATTSECKYQVAGDTLYVLTPSRLRVDMVTETRATNGITRPHMVAAE